MKFLLIFFIFFIISVKLVVTTNKTSLANNSSEDSFGFSATQNETQRDSKSVKFTTNSKNNKQHINTKNDKNITTKGLDSKTNLQDLNLRTDSENSTSAESNQSITNNVTEHNELNKTKHYLKSEKDLQIKNETNKVLVRKCCEIFEYFNVLLASCQPVETTSDFHIQSSHLANNSSALFKFKTSTIQTCPNTHGPPSILQGISNETHKITESGYLLELKTLNEFNHSQYCLENVGTSENDTLFTLAFCPEITEYFYDHEEAAQYDEIINEEEKINNHDLNLEGKKEHIVRKCCGQNEYYNTHFQKCTKTKEVHIFTDAVQELSFGNKKLNLNIISSRIGSCPDQLKHKIVIINKNDYRLLQNGILVEISTEFQHNYTHYCLEMIGHNLKELTFTLSLCSHSYIIPKCCPHNHYFDELALDCLPLDIPSSEIDLLSHFDQDPNSYIVTPENHILQCSTRFPVKELAKDLYISEGMLCSSMCYEKDSFCVDYFGHPNKGIQASAYICQEDYFVKCCKMGYIYSTTKHKCVVNTNDHSLMLDHLIRLRKTFHSFDSSVCKTTILDDQVSSYVTWDITDSGSYLVVSANNNNKKYIRNYCLDDSINKKGNIGPVAFVCEKEVVHFLPNEHHLISYSEKGSLGKCCPDTSSENHAYYYSSETKNCEYIESNETLKDSIYLQEGNFTKMHFHDFPHCPDGIAVYHSYPMTPGPHDYAGLLPNGFINILSTDGKCVHVEAVINDRDFCVEYTLIEGKLVPSAFLCAISPVIENYNDKFAVITSLMAISCVALLLTLIFILSQRVRRGFITTRKVNTLAGKILLSFICSHLIGFTAMAITQHQNSLNKVDSVGCFVLAGFVQFFNLATFCWNTSICLESLLLTIDVSVSELTRYVLHSMWAWGFPAFMTSLMYAMNARRDELPCGVITPKIGVYHCFHSDNEAKLVYFYVPILITLVANMLFLFGGKALRRAKLRRLERGVPKRTAQARGQTENGVETNQAAHSGLRTHQSHNTKTESLRIVLWTGGLWFMELAGFIFNIYIFTSPSNTWYGYLWYIPTSINALRGVGIFVIIVLTPEKRKDIGGTLRRAKVRIRKFYKTFKKTNTNDGSIGLANRTTTRRFSNDDRFRNMSVTTMISTLSSSIYNTHVSPNQSNHDETTRKASIGSFLSSKFDVLRKASSVSNYPKESTKRKESVNVTPKRKIGMIRSVSQIDRRASLSMANIAENSETGQGVTTRRCSVPLPKLQEEESTFDREDTDIELDGEVEKTNNQILNSVSLKERCKSMSEVENNININSTKPTFFLGENDSPKFENKKNQQNSKEMLPITIEEEITTQLPNDSTDIGVDRKEEFALASQNLPESFV